MRGASYQKKAKKKINRRRDDSYGDETISDELSAEIMSEADLMEPNAHQSVLQQIEFEEKMRL